MSKGDIDWDSPTSVVGVDVGGKLHGNNSAFIADPSTYFKNNACILNAELIETSGMEGQTRTTMYNLASIGKCSHMNVSTNTVRISANIYQFSPAPFLSEVRLKQSVTGPEFNWLPFTPRMLEAITMDAGADYFITGPLSGCNIYIATRPNSPPMAFHANANPPDGKVKKKGVLETKKHFEAAEKAENIAFKDDEADRVAKAYGCTIVGRLARGEYDIPAFVWARRKGNLWKVYVHHVDLSAASFTNRKLCEVAAW